MTWNYRVMKHTWDNGTVSYGVHEVYYSGTGVVQSWTTIPITGHFDTIEELEESLKMMLDAFEEEVLDEDAIVESMAKKEKGN